MCMLIKVDDRGASNKDEQSNNLNWKYWTCTNPSLTTPYADYRPYTAVENADYAIEHITNHV